MGAIDGPCRRGSFINVNVNGTFKSNNLQQQQQQRGQRRMAKVKPATTTAKVAPPVDTQWINVFMSRNYHHRWREVKKTQIKIWNLRFRNNKQRKKKCANFVGLEYRGIGLRIRRPEVAGIAEKDGARIPWQRGEHVHAGSGAGRAGQSEEEVSFWAFFCCKSVVNIFFKFTKSSPYIS